MGIQRNLFLSIEIVAVVFALSSGVGARAEDWSKDAPVPIDGRPNPYLLNSVELNQSVINGRLHALNYPVTVTAALYPYRPIAEFINGNSLNPLRYMLEQLVSGFSGYSSMDQFETWLGMSKYPKEQGSGAYSIPFENGARPAHHMGFTIQGRGFTVSCAECHSGTLFGRQILGMSNRFSRANELFVKALKVEQYVTPGLFQMGTGADDVETAMYASASHATAFVGAIQPAQLGLDTSLAQVALSLAKRDKDGWATRTEGLQARPERLENHVADSKPAVWWNLKYKNRWLSDGSVVSGNPIFTNFIWNEIGRGTDLHELDNWLKQNETTVRDLTTAVFAAEAPRWTDFFPADSIDLKKAQNGERIFNQTCARCHGVYTKAWSGANSQALSLVDLLQTTHVEYPNRVEDVGTDPSRYLGMASLVQLNDLEISKNNSIVIEPQVGYMPPPLVGIWARWPYFHNNSAPTLCAVLARFEDRPVTYWAREATDSTRDFDRVCNGYPKAAPSRANPALKYDSRREGMHASGHDNGIFLKDGQELLSANDKMDLIEYLKTL